MLVLILRMHPQKLAAFVLNFDQATEAARLVFLFQQRVQFSEHCTLGEDGAVGFELRGVVAAQPIADLLASFQKTLGTGFAKLQLVLDRIERCGIHCQLGGGDGDW